MLAELAIANAAFEVIRTAVSNGKEVWELGDHLSKFSDAGREIDHKARMAKKGSEQESDLEIFMAQEAMRNKRDQLKELMVRTRTDRSTFTSEELIDAGYIAVVQDAVVYDEETHKLIWNGTAFERVGLTDLEIAAKTAKRWVEIRAHRDSKICEVEWRILRNQSEVRLGLEPTEDIHQLDVYVQALRVITDQSDDPLEIVWPHEGHTHDDSDSTHTHDE